MHKHKRNKFKLSPETIRNLNGKQSGQVIGAFSLDCTCDFTSCASLTDCPYCPSLYPC